jgi:hypothetical protein
LLSSQAHLPSQALEPPPQSHQPLAQGFTCCLGFAVQNGNYACHQSSKRGIPPMSKSVITSYTLMDFLSEADMIAFLSFAEKNMQKHADNLRANGMTKFYISRVFNKGDKFTIGNWLEYKDQDSYLVCDKIWQAFLSESDNANKFNFISKVVPYRGIVQYDFS